MKTMTIITETSNMMIQKLSKEELSKEIGQLLILLPNKDIKNQHDWINGITTTPLKERENNKQ